MGCSILKKFTLGFSSLFSLGSWSYWSQLNSVALWTTLLSQKKKIQPVWQQDVWKHSKKNEKKRKERKEKGTPGQWREGIIVKGMHSYLQSGHKSLSTLALINWPFSNPPGFLWKSRVKNNSAMRSRHRDIIPKCCLEITVQIQNCVTSEAHLCCIYIFRVI